MLNNNTTTEEKYEHMSYTANIDYIGGKRTAFIVSNSLEMEKSCSTSIVGNFSVMCIEIFNVDGSDVITSEILSVSIPDSVSPYAIFT